MTGILLSGCNGKMGKVITAAAANTDDIEIVGGIDLNTEAGAGYPVFPYRGHTRGACPHRCDN